MNPRPGVSSALLILCYLLLRHPVGCFPDRGQWDFVLSQEQGKEELPKSLFAGSMIFVQVICDAADSTMISITWSLTETPCWDSEGVERSTNGTKQIKPPAAEIFECKHDAHIILNELLVDGQQTKSSSSGPQQPVFTIPYDGIYIFMLKIDSSKEFEAKIHIEIKAPYGYLSAIDYPLLLFYGIMCIVYVFLGGVWLLVSFLQWRDLLRIQFWIGGVIFLGMLEKAMFYAEYQNINTTGVSIRGVVLLAEWVSCAKRTLARMLVIIVSLGFGIVKPRLGPMLHRVVGSGALYFILACVESYLRVVVHVKNDPNNQNLVASIPLAVLDSAICWWIFTSLLQTTRTLRLRRNTVKLSLYRHFTNTLIFAVIASVIFMLYSIKTRRMNECFRDWKELWVDEAFWHILFSFLLLVIMVLWRPTNNNQRYAFTPLLDNPEDDEFGDETEDEDQFVADAYGVKMRGPPRSSSPVQATVNEDEDLQWVEDNIPAAIADAALPIIDSDEEILNTRFEVSKMQ